MNAVADPPQTQESYELIDPPPDIKGTTGTSANASSPRIARNAVMGYIATAVGMATGFVATPLLLKYLGPAQFGLWALLGGMIGYVGLLEIGISNATAKRVAECLAIGDRRRLQQVLGTASCLYVVVSLLVLVATCLLTLTLDRVLHLPANSLGIARVCMVILGLNQSIVFLFNIQSAILFGAGRLDLISIASTAIATAATGAQVWLVFQGFGIRGMAVCAIANTIATGLLARYLIRRRLPEIRGGMRHANLAVAKELLSYGSRNAAIALGGGLAFGSDVIIIGLMLPISNVAYYVVASKLINLVRVVAAKPIDVLMPAFAHSHAIGDKQRQFRLFTESTCIALGLSLPLIIVLCTFGDKIIRAWVGSGYGTSYPVLVVLALVLMVQLPGHAVLSFITGTERNRFFLRIILFAVPANVVLSVILTRSLGPIGVALGSLVAVSITDALVMPIHISHQLGYTYREYLRRTWQLLAIPGCIGCLMAVALRGLTWSSNLGITILSITVTTFSVWIVFASVSLGRQRFRKYCHLVRAAVSM